MPNQTAYGFIGLEHLAGQRVASGNVRTVNTAISLTLEEYNRQVDEALRELAQRTIDHKLRYKLPGGGTLQAVDEWGNPLPVKTEGYHDVAFPIQRGATAWGDNIETRALMTVDDVNTEILSAMQRDADWMRRHILAALFNNTAWTYKDPDYGDLSIQPLANGDGVTYLKRSGTNGTDTHYYAQAAAIADANNPFETWFDELNEHPENGGPYVAYIPTNLKSAVMGLADFVEAPDRNLQRGANADQLATTVPAGFGDAVLGYVGGIYVAEWSILPSNYGLVVARGARTPVLMMREQPAVELQGFFRYNHSPDGNLNQYNVRRIAGFGAYNRVGALAFRIGDASYAVPTGYTAPLA